MNRRPTAACQNTFKAGFGGIADDQSTSGQGAYEMVKLCLDGSKIGENICVIEFQVIQNSGARPVMYEL